MDTTGEKLARMSGVIYSFFGACYSVAYLVKNHRSFSEKHRLYSDC